MAYNCITLVPAYGRDYTSKTSLMEDWQAGKDFRAYDYKGGEGYINIQQLADLKLQAGITHLHFRYARQSKVHVVKL